MRTIQGVLLALCALGAIGDSLFPQEFDDEWESWKVGYGKAYASEEEEVMRRLTWQKNLELVVKHNMEHQRGVHSYRLGMNQFADLENQEFVAFFNGYRNSNTSEQGSTFLAPDNVELPASVDWRRKGYVTPVKDQMQCGSCWAFSATGSLEGQTFAKTGKLISLSEQNLVDCSNNHGCNGGTVERAFQYVIDNGGIDTEDSYPYQGVDQWCTFKTSSIGATCTGYKHVVSRSEQALKKAVATVGPISVAIDADHTSFRLYESGVYDEPYCSSTRLTHGVLVVGYDTTPDGTDYWIVKNSFNTGWGNQGYIWMSRNKDNQCGIATRASFPLV